MNTDKKKERELATEDTEGTENNLLDTAFYGFLKRFLDAGSADDAD